VVSLHQGQRLTYQQFHARVEEAARGLLSLGVQVCACGCSPSLFCPWAFFGMAAAAELCTDGSAVHVAVLLPGQPALTAAQAPALMQPARVLVLHGMWLAA
jgi:hypothetical protein